MSPTLCACRTTAQGRHIEQDVRAAIRRRADLDVQAIHVSVRNGPATLTGTVTSWGEVTAARRAAAAAPGIQDVGMNVRGRAAAGHRGRPALGIGPRERRRSRGRSAPSRLPPRALVKASPREDNRTGQRGHTIANDDANGMCFELRSSDAAQLMSMGPLVVQGAVSLGSWHQRANGPRL